MENSIKIEDINDIKKKIHIKVEPDAVNDKFDQFFEGVRKNAQIPGFRKGKAPASMLKKYFKDRALGAISQMLTSKYYEDAIREYNISPVGQPEIEEKNDSYVGKFNDDDSYSVSLVVETMPKIDPVGYDELDLEKPDHKLEDIVDSKLMSYREQFAEREQILDSGAKLDDTLIIDFKGFVDGEAFAGGEGKGVTIEKLGSSNFISGFEDALVDMKHNEEKKFTVTFPGDFKPEHLAGKDAEFDVKVVNIVRKTIADVDEDLAMMAGFESVGGLKESVEEEAREELKEKVRQALEEDVCNKLLESNNNFMVPEVLVKNEAQRIIGQNKMSELSDEMSEQVTLVAKNNIRKTLLIDAICDKENIQIAPDELNVYLEEQANIFNKEKDELVSMLSNTGQMESFVSVLKNRKTVDHIIEINSKEVKDGNGSK